MSGFFAMGGYAAFVWPSFGLSLAVLVLAAVLQVRAHARAQAMAARLDADEPR